MQILIPASAEYNPDSGVYESPRVILLQSFIVLPSSPAVNINLVYAVKSSGRFGRGKGRTVVLIFSY